MCLSSRKRIASRVIPTNLFFLPRVDLHLSPVNIWNGRLVIPTPTAAAIAAISPLHLRPRSAICAWESSSIENSSSYKKALLALDKDIEIVASQLAGDFVLPDDPQQRVVLIAGGIGVTPFRSMIKYLLDNRHRRPITLFYSAATVNDFVYKDVFDRAQVELGIKTIYSVTDHNNLPSSWTGQVGRISPQMIKSAVPDYRNCLFYISGPRGMVDSLTDTLHKLGIAGYQIKTDYFAGIRLIKKWTQPRVHFLI